MNPEAKATIFTVCGCMGMGWALFRPLRMLDATTLDWAIYAMMVVISFAMVVYGVKMGKKHVKKKGNKK